MFLTGKMKMVMITWRMMVVHILFHNFTILLIVFFLDNISPEPIEPLSAADERRHARYWQRMVLPGGEQRTIDMRVIEPYKRVLSHGGYLRAGGHTAIVG